MSEPPHKRKATTDAHLTDEDVEKRLSKREKVTRPDLAAVPDSDAKKPTQAELARLDIETAMRVLEERASQRSAQAAASAAAASASASASASDPDAKMPDAVVSIGPEQLKAEVRTALMTISPEFKDLIPLVFEFCPIRVLHQNVGQRDIATVETEPWTGPDPRDVLASRILSRLQQIYFKRTPFVCTLYVYRKTESWICCLDNDGDHMLRHWVWYAAIKTHWSKTSDDEELSTPWCLGCNNTELRHDDDCFWFRGSNEPRAEVVPTVASFVPVCDSYWLVPTEWDLRLCHRATSSRPLRFRTLNVYIGDEPCPPTPRRWAK